MEALNPNVNNGNIRTWAIVKLTSGRPCVREETGVKVTPFAVPPVYPAPTWEYTPAGSRPEAENPVKE